MCTSGRPEAGMEMIHAIGNLRLCQLSNGIECLGSTIPVFYNGVGKRLRRGWLGCTTMHMNGNYDDCKLNPLQWIGVVLSHQMADNL
jgi:hypothetical protein